MKIKYRTLEEKESKVSNQLFEDAAKLRDKEKRLSSSLLKAHKSWQESEENTIIKIDSEGIQCCFINIGIPISKVTN